MLAAFLLLLRFLQCSWGFGAIRGNSTRRRVWYDVFAQAPDFWRTRAGSLGNGLRPLVCRIYGASNTRWTGLGTCHGFYARRGKPNGGIAGGFSGRGIAKLCLRPAGG